MKKSITVLFTALSLIGTGAISNIQNTSAANIAPTTSYSYNDSQLTNGKTVATVSAGNATVYNYSEKKHAMISANKAFERNSKWQTDIKRTMTNGTIWYRVSTNEWLKADNVTISNSNNTTPPSNGGNTGNTGTGTQNSSVTADGVKQAFINKLGLSQRGIKVGRPAGELEEVTNYFGGKSYHVNGTDGQYYDGLAQSVDASASAGFKSNDDAANQLMSYFKTGQLNKSNNAYVEITVTMTGNTAAHVNIMWWTV